MLNNLFANINAASTATMVPLVAVTGFLDGIHPCAIAILIFFIAFLLTLQRSFKNIFWLGMVYIFVIFLTYLAIGVGLLSGIMFFGQHHFFAKVGSWLLIILGAVNLRDYFFPRIKLGLKLPSIPHDKIKNLLQKASFPTVAVAAFLVGLCSVPCSGGIYAAITALLASKTTFFTGFLYLLLYNLIFVLPLVIILLIAADQSLLSRVQQWQKKERRGMRLWGGVAMIILGIVIYLL